MTLQIFTPRGFYFGRGSQAITSQIGAALSQGASPNLIIPTSALPNSVVSGLVNYLTTAYQEMQTATNPNPFDIMGDVGSDLNGVSKSGAAWVEKANAAIDNARRINEALEQKKSPLRIKTMGIKPAPLVDYRTQTTTRWNKYLVGQDPMNSPLTRREAIAGIEIVKQSIEAIARYAHSHGMTINVETDQPSYFVSRPNEFRPT
ncbi:hypothetical protein HOC01_06190 [archaeon]|jgi:hypothetical protein|nr:hypothetical protein [archaeon]MBT6697567.1 hypothetical protein [archaeon]